MGNYLLNDFGARKKLLQSSKNHELATAYVVDEQIRNLKVKVIDLYTDVLLEFNSVAAKMKMLELNQRLFSIKQRLFDAGQIPKTDLSDQSLKVAQLLDSIQQNKKSFSEKLKELSYYTHQDYARDDVQVADLPDEAFKKSTVDFNNYLDARHYDADILSKRQEILALVGG
jgi:outer membrane protein TolC